MLYNQYEYIYNTIILHNRRRNMLETRLKRFRFDRRFVQAKKHRLNVILSYVRCHCNIHFYDTRLGPVIRLVIGSLKVQDTLLASKGETIKCILFQRDFA